MNTQQQAYINGFVKRASEYGLNQYEAIELLKSSAFASSGGYELEPESYSIEGEDEENRYHKLNFSQKPGKGVLNHLKRNAGKYIGAGVGLPLAAYINSTASGYVPGTLLAATLPASIGSMIDNTREENFLKNQMHNPETLDKILDYVHSKNPPAEKK
jgi:hypothetical protein